MRRLTGATRRLLVLTACGAALTLTSGGPAQAGVGTASRSQPADPTHATLYATSFVGSSDGWAVSFQQAPDTTITPLAEHWNGSTWSVSATALPDGRSHGVLQAVDAVSASDVWAVGSTTSDTDGSSRTLAEQWNGTRWKVVPTADPTTAFNASLQGVSATSAKDVWATGLFFDTSGAGDTLTEHWNGGRWRLVASPNTPDSPDTELHAVSASTADAAWATGFTTVDGSTFLPLTEHWDGTAWSIVGSATPTGSQNTYLEGVHEISASNVWAAGGSFVSTDIPFMQHWDGSAWTLVPVA